MGAALGSISATVHLGAGLADALDGTSACYRGAYGASEGCEIAVDGNVASASGTDFSGYENMTIALGFEAGTFTPGQTIA